MNSYWRGLIERQNAGRVLTQGWINWFGRHGVPATVLAFSPAGEPDMVLQDSVTWSADRCNFAFDDEGESALTFPLRDRFGHMQDVCAWQPRSGHVATLLNRACMIGADQLDAPRLGDGLLICESPLQWLQARRQGVVILDPKRALPQLLDVGPVIAVSFDHGRQLREMFEAALPVVLVPKQSEAAA